MFSEAVAFILWLHLSLQHKLTVINGDFFPILGCLCYLPKTIPSNGMVRACRREVRWKDAELRMPWAAKGDTVSENEGSRARDVRSG